MFPEAFQVEHNKSFEVQDVTWDSYGVGYESSGEQDSAIEHAVLNHDRLAEENAELREVVKKMRQGYVNLIDLRALPNTGWYGESQDLIDMCGKILPNK